jgi:RNA 3'-terminal phosphate cyclase (ATP)
MIDIDGSHGEGGGQIVRTAVALASVTGTSIRIKNIRPGRPKPGLAPQHAQAIEALAHLSSARTSGVGPGSVEITFQPGEIGGGRYRVDIGTAGSVTLLVQCLLPAMIKADGPVSLEVRGGTDVRWSPSIDYLKNVFLPALAKFGVGANLDLRRRGYYPRGGGLVALEVVPGPLRPAFLEAQDTVPIQGVSHCSNLPEHVARRQAESAGEALREAGYAVGISLEVLEVPSTGSGITLWSGFKGACALGERGVRAESVGRAAADEMILELRSRASVDVHLADQLVPYLALAGGGYTAREISRHASTNIWTARHLLSREIVVSRDGALFRIEGRP